MDTMDGDVQRLATHRVWSEDEGRRIVAAEWRVTGGVCAPLRHRGAPALLSDHAARRPTADRRGSIPCACCRRAATRGTPPRWRFS